jgi:hypothetical protein
MEIKILKVVFICFIYTVIGPTPPGTGVNAEHTYKNNN